MRKNEKQEREGGRREISVVMEKMSRNEATKRLLERWQKERK